MSRRLELYEVWNEIRRLTGDGSGFFLVKNSDKALDALRQIYYVDVWILYRGTPGKPGAARLGKSRDPRALLRLIRKCATPAPSASSVATR